MRGGRRLILLAAVAVVGLAVATGGAAAHDGHGEQAVTMNTGDSVEEFGAAPLAAENGTRCTAAGYMYQDTIICGGEVVDPDDETSALSLYLAALQTDSGNNQYMQLMDNYLTDTEQVAWLKAENAVAKSAVNGSTESVALVNAERSINDYYAVHQQNLLDRWNLLVTGFESYRNQSQSIGYDMWDESRTQMLNSPGFSTDYADWEFHSVESTTVEHTLANGDSFPVKALELTVTIKDIDSDGTTVTDTTQVSNIVGPWNADHELTYNPSGNNFKTLDASFNYLRLNNATAETDDRNYLSAERMEHDWAEIESQLDSVKTQTETFTTGVYNDLEAGVINASEIVGRTNKMFQYANEFKSNNSSYNEGISALISAGFSTPASANTSYMKVEFNPQFDPNRTITREGMLLSSTSPNSSWELNKTYQSGDIPGTVFVHTLGGTERVVDGEFRIVGAYDTDGTPITDPKISSPDPDYGATNTTEIQQVVEDLTERIDRIDDLQTSNSGSGAGTDDGDGPDSAGILNNFLGGFFDGLGGISDGLGQWVAYLVVGLVGLLVILRVVSG